MPRKKKLVGLLIGRKIRVVDSKNKSNIGLAGKVIDESKETIQILCSDGSKKRLIKKIIKFVFENGEKGRM